MKEEKEICIFCKKELPYSKDINIAVRYYYVEGAGDLCIECSNKIYANKENDI